MSWPPCGAHLNTGELLSQWSSFQGEGQYGDRITETDIENLVQRCIDGAPDEADTERLVAGSVSDRWLEDRSEAMKVLFRFGLSGC